MEDGLFFGSCWNLKFVYSSRFKSHKKRNLLVWSKIIKNYNIKMLSLQVPQLSQVSTDLQSFFHESLYNWFLNKLVERYIFTKSRKILVFFFFLLHVLNLGPDNFTPTLIISNLKVCFCRYFVMFMFYVFIYNTFHLKLPKYAQKLDFFMLNYSFDRCFAVFTQNQIPHHI